MTETVQSPKRRLLNKNRTMNNVEKAYFNGRRMFVIHKSVISGRGGQTSASQGGLCSLQLAHGLGLAL
jgi:hypothetical protein